MITSSDLPALSAKPGIGITGPGTASDQSSSIPWMFPEACGSVLRPPGMAWSFPGSVQHSQSVPGMLIEPYRSVATSPAARSSCSKVANTNGASPQPAKPWGGGGVSGRGSGRSVTVALCAPLCDRRWR
jgi:hypothetical protein